MTNSVSLRQAVTPDHMLGRMNASMEFLYTGAVTLGLLVGGLLDEMLGMRLTLVIAAAGKLYCGLWLIFSPIPKNAACQQNRFKSISTRTP